MSKLLGIWNKYHDYVNHCLGFDDSPEEIMGFDDWAELHHGVSREEANQFMYDEADFA